MGEVWEWGWDLQRTLPYPNSLPSPANVGRAVWICASDLPGADFSSLIGQAGELHRVRGELSPSRVDSQPQTVLDTV